MRTAIDRRVRVGGVHASLRLLTCGLAGLGLVLRAAAATEADTGDETFKLREVSTFEYGGKASSGASRANARTNLLRKLKRIRPLPRRNRSTARFTSTRTANSRTPGRSPTLPSMKARARAKAMTGSTLMPTATLTCATIRWSSRSGILRKRPGSITAGLRRR